MTADVKVFLAVAGWIAFAVTLYKLTRPASPSGAELPRPPNDSPVNRVVRSKLLPS